MHDCFGFELQLETRQPDRVHVSVVLAPSAGTPTDLGGVALELFTRSGDSISPRLLLPIAGTLQQTMVSTVELRALQEIPLGSRIVATAWYPGGQIEATCPTEPWTELECHARGRNAVAGLSSAAYRLARAAARELEVLSPQERQVLARLFPWIDEPMIPPVLAAGVLDTVDDQPEDGELVDAFCEQYDLDDECADWLKDLMEEEV